MSRPVPRPTTWVLAWSAERRSRAIDDIRSIALNARAHRNLGHRLGCRRPIDDPAVNRQVDNDGASVGGGQGSSAVASRLPAARRMRTAVREPCRSR